MRLEKIRIVNYRSVKDFSMPLERFTAIVGQNNAGKSNILRAIQWLLRPCAMQEKDFNDEDGDVVVFGKITGIDASLLNQLSPEHQKSISPFVSAESMLLKRVMDHSNLAKKGISLFVSNEVDTDFDKADWKKNPTGIDQAIQALFPDVIEVPAMSNSFEDATKYTAKTTMAQLVGQIIEAFKTSHQATIETSLQSIRDLVSIDGVKRATELDQIDQMVSTNLADIFPGIDVKLHIELPTVDEIFKGATFKTIEKGIPRDIDFLGHGTQRSIQMALIRSLSQLVVSGSQGSAVLLVVEEPELYLHPYAIELTRAALKRLADAYFQVVLVTHSPMVIAQEDVATTVMVRANPSHGTERLNTIKERIDAHIKDRPSQAEVLFSLSNKVGLLFSDKVLLVEGRTEYRIIPSIFEKESGSTLLSRSIALVPQDGVDNTAICIKIINDLGLKALAITDLDFALRGAVKNGLVAPDDSSITELKKVLISDSTAQGYSLDSDGLPTKGNGRRASDGYRLLGKNPDAIVHISNLAEKLKAKGVWIWKKGRIEDHLSLTGKGEGAWASFLGKLKVNSLSSLTNSASDFTELVAWLEL